MISTAPESVAAELRRTGEAIGPSLIPTFLKQARQLMVSDVRENFQTSTGPDGTPWPQLRFPRPNGGNTPLIDKGLLRASVVTATASGHVEQMTANSLTIGTALPYAEIHQEGGTILPVSAKALAIPVTREAKRAGSPRRFPRKLVLLWAHGATSGVLAEPTRQQRRLRQRRKSLTKPIRQFTAKQRSIMTRIKRLQKRARGRSSNSGVGRQLETAYRQLRTLQQRTGRQVRQRQQLDRDASKAWKIQYALVKSVTVPARPFLGFGDRLEHKLDSAMVRLVARAFHAQPTTGA